MGIGGKSFQAWGNNSCKGPEAAPCLVCCRNSKEACDGWSKMSKGVRGRRGRQAGSGVGGAGPCGPQGGLGLSPRGKWEPWRAVGRGGGT